MKTVFVDVDTQLDFLTPAGALAVPGASEIAPAITQLTRYALASYIPIVSTLDTHTENDVEFKTWKPHCIIGTQGHAKFAGSLLAKPVLVSDTPHAAEQVIPAIQSVQQIVVAKHTIDIFASLNLRKILEFIAADRYIIYGLVTEYCVRAAAFGLLGHGRVEIVTDAVKELEVEARDSVFERFVSEGGRLTKLQSVLSGQVYTKQKSQTS